MPQIKQWKFTLIAAILAVIISILFLFKNNPPAYAFLVYGPAMVMTKCMLVNAHDQLTLYVWGSILIVEFSIFGWLIDHKLKRIKFVVTLVSFIAFHVICAGIAWR